MATLIARTQAQPRSNRKYEIQDVHGHGADYLFITNLESNDQFHIQSTNSYERELIKSYNDFQMECFIAMLIVEKGV